MTEHCVIFDLDGTLVDSEGLCNQAFIDLLPEINELVETLTIRYRGMRLASILGDIANRFGRPLPEDFEIRYRQRVSELFARDLKPCPYVREMLDAIPFSRCVASSGPIAKINQALRISGLNAYFPEGRIFSAYDVGSWKPDPGLFLHAAQAMGFKPEHCFVVEDSEVGIAAANAAGMTAFHYAPNREDVLCMNAAESFHCMSELPRLLRNCYEISFARRDDADSTIIG